MVSVLTSNGRATKTIRTQVDFPVLLTGKGRPTIATREGRKGMEGVAHLFFMLSVEVFPHGRCSLSFHIAHTLLIALVFLIALAQAFGFLSVGVQHDGHRDHAQDEANKAEARNQCGGRYIHE
jgi:hypothetical protein